VLLAVAMPVVSSVLCLLIPKRLMWLSPIVSTLLMFVSVIAAAVLYAKGWQSDIEWRMPWFNVGETYTDLVIVADGLSMPMLSMVILVSFLVHLYSVGFMADDQHAGRYFAFLGFFTFAMLGLVISGNLLVLFCFWELVGFSSYLLIGHWRERTSAGAAATKAFIINRIGDALFVVGLALTWSSAKSFDFEGIFLNPPPVIAGLCIFGGVIGKSAQFPLLTWLPDAMEGPTPVSALIHAATMVAAGVFLLLRIPFVFSPATYMVIAIVGAITALYGGWLALQQFDLKKILAYSTISQLGLMMLAIGAGSEEGAFVHLLAHALFKACLFLAAGAIIHSLYHVAKQNEFSPQDIRNMGGFYKITPRLFLATTAALAAICGLPLFSGFVSKEMMVVPMIHRALETGDKLMWLYVIVFFLSSMLTILYSYRMYVAVFFGPRATPFADLSPVPPVMQWPVSLLAILSLWIFFSLNLSGPGNFLRYEDVGAFHSLHPRSGMIAWMSFGWTLFSLALAWWLFTRKNAEFHKEKYPLDSLYQSAIINPVIRTSNSLARFDRKGIDSALHIFVYGQVAIAKIAGYVDRYVVDGSVLAVAWIGRAAGNLLRGGTGGRVQSYLAWSAIALIIFIFWVLK
jgi:NADH-quinone oxidoreductase subunit L